MKNETSTKLIMKKHTLDQVKDEFIGKVGTPRRDAYEAKLKKELQSIE